MISLFYIFSIIFSFESGDLSKIEDLITEHKNIILENELKFLDDKITDSYLQLESVDFRNSPLQYSDHLKKVKAYQEFNFIIKLTQNLYQKYSNNSFCSRFENSLYKKLKKIFDEAKSVNFKEDLNNNNFINRNIINPFETIYVYLKSIENILNDDDNENKCKELKKSINNKLIPISKTVKNISKIITNIDQHFNIFITYYSIGSCNFDLNSILSDNMNKHINETLVDASYNEILITKFLEFALYRSNYFETIKELEHTLLILSSKIFIYFNKNIFDKLNVFSISIEGLINNINDNSIRSKNISALIENNQLFLSYSKLLNKYLLSDIFSEIIYTYSRDSEDTLWENISLNNVDPIIVANNNGDKNISNFLSFPINKQKAFILKHFLSPNSILTINEKVNKYINLLFGADYDKIQKSFIYFNSLDENNLGLFNNDKYKNLRNLSMDENGKVKWTPELINIMISNNNTYK